MKNEKARASETLATGAGCIEQPESVFIRIKEVARLLDCSYASASRCVAAVNRKQKAAGMFVLSGRCNRRMLFEYIGEGRQRG